MRKISWMIAAVLVLTVLCGTALAGDKPVSLDTSSVEDGQTDVPVDVVIELVFTNNVVNVSVRDNNAACFSLESGGKTVPIDVIMADDQVEPNLKRVISVAPKSRLDEGKKYSLVISGSLTAKNGNSIGEVTTITFTTEGGGASYLWYIIIAAAVVIFIVVILIVLRRRNGTKQQAKIN